MKCPVHFPLPLKAILAAFLLAALGGAAGCTTNPVLAAKRAKVTTVRIEPRVNTPGMRYGVDLSGGGLSMAIASMIVQKAGADEIADMSAAMKAAEIDVSELTRVRFEELIRARSEWTVVDANPEATFVLTIGQMGFDRVNFSSRRVPFLVLHAKLVTPAGKTLWTKASTLGALKDTDIGATWDAYRNDAGRLRRDWQIQVDAVVKAVLKDMRAP